MFFFCFLMSFIEQLLGVLTSKLALKYAGEQVDALRAVANASRERSLHTFEDAKAKFPDALKNDPVRILLIEALVYITHVVFLLDCAIAFDSSLFGSVGTSSCAFGRTVFAH